MAKDKSDEQVAEPQQQSSQASSTEAPYESAGATVLSQQPNEIPPIVVSAKKEAEWQLLRGHLEMNLASMHNWRESWWSENYADLATYIEPRRSIHLTHSTGGQASANKTSRGRQINNNIVDPTATYAVRVCASGLMSGLASPSRPWFKVVPKIKNVDLDQEGREWIDEVEERIYTILAGSNFYNSFYQECEDDVIFGTAPCIIYEDDAEVIRCYNPVVGEYYLSSSSTMRVDSIYRVFPMTIKQIVEFFGLANCTPEIQKMWSSKGTNMETETLIAHAIEPNYALNKEGVGQIKGNFAYREVYWVAKKGSKAPLSMRGFVEQPFTASRWSTQSNDPYGRSVGMDTLPDIIQLQVETLRKAEGIEKQVRPPLLASMELKNQPSSIISGHVTYVQNMGAGSGMRPIYEVNPDINALMLDLQEIQNRIKVGFFNDLFLMLEQARNQKITAYEVAQKMQEKLQVLGPVIENLISESLRPRLRRVFSIMQRKGMIPEPPESLNGMPLEVEFVSMLVLAQKAAATGGIERLISLVGGMAAVYPDVKDNLDPDKTVREMNDLLGNPQKILRGMEDITKERKARAAQQAEMMKKQEEAAQIEQAGVGADAAKTLSETKVGPSASALGQLLGVDRVQ